MKMIKNWSLIIEYRRGWNEINSKFNLMKEKIGENILRYENHQKIFIWSEFMAYRSIDEGASEISVATEGLADQMLACMGRW